ncbi:MAG: TRAP transporter small permease subunit [Pseudomonadota bacterium]
MRRLGGAAARLTDLFDILAMMALAALTAVVAGSILARALFDLTGGGVNLLIPGAIELSGLCLFVAVTAALPGATIRGLTRVDLLTARLPAGVARGLDMLWSLTLATLAGLLVWLLSARAWREAAGSHVSQDLALPLWPFTAFAAVAAAALVLAALWRAFHRPAAS